MSERYTPSEEDMAKATELLTEDQRQMSANREGALERGSSGASGWPRPEMDYDSNSKTLIVSLEGKTKRYTEAGALRELKTQIDREKAASQTFLNILAGMQSLIERDLDKS